MKKGTAFLRKRCFFQRIDCISNSMCAELSWSHYRVLMRISDEVIRAFYLEECRKSAWSVRQLGRNHLEIIERGIAGALPDFNSLMYVVVKKEVVRSLFVGFSIQKYAQLSFGAAVRLYFCQRLVWEV